MDLGWVYLRGLGANLVEVSPFTTVLGLTSTSLGCLARVWGLMPRPKLHWIGFDRAGLDLVSWTRIELGWGELDCLGMAWLGLDWLRFVRAW